MYYHGMTDIEEFKTPKVNKGLFSRMHVHNFLSQKHSTCLVT